MSGRAVARRPTDQLHPIVNDYFAVLAHPDTVRFRVSFQRNDRSLSQDGYFLWQPNFHQPLNVGQHFKIRVPGGYKERILSEMYSIGYTARRLVRGSVGDAAHARVCGTLGLPV